MWVNYVSSLVDVDTTLTYHNTKGQPFQRKLSSLLFHVFNHATHHRGQISAITFHLAQMAPSMDAVYMTAFE
jgi:uncharacterized damage-inducible protein DinB